MRYRVIGSIRCHNRQFNNGDVVTMDMLGVTKPSKALLMALEPIDPAENVTPMPKQAELVQAELVQPEPLLKPSERDLVSPATARALDMLQERVSGSDTAPSSKRRGRPRKRK